MKIIFYFLVFTLFSLTIGEGYCQTYKALDFSFKDASRDLKNEEYDLLIEKLNKLEITQNNISPIDKFLILNLYFRAYNGLSDYANSLKIHESMKHIVDSKENTFSSNPTVKQILITQETELKDLGLITSTIKENPALKEERTIQNQESNEKIVTLMVSGQGKTQDEAKQIALRNAVEQAFGAFISSKTEILNDELVKDEIVSVTNGNIQKFEIISEVKIPNGDYATTLNATVSISKLTSFVQNKGIEIEFKGSLLAANIKQQMLNEQNEIKSIENISKTCKEILDTSSDFLVSNGEPKQQNNNNLTWIVPITVNVKFNKNIEQFKTHLLNSLKALSMSENEILEYKNLGKKTYKIAIEDGKYDKNVSSIYHFRSFSSITKIIDLIYYTKSSVLNFEVDNGIYIVSRENFVPRQNQNDNGNTANQKSELINSVYDKLTTEERQNKKYKLKISAQNITPFLRCTSAFGMNPGGYRGQTPGKVIDAHGLFEDPDRKSLEFYKPFLGTVDEMKEFKYIPMFEPDEITILKFESFIPLAKDLSNENFYFGEENFYPQNRAYTQRRNPDAKSIDDLNNDFQAIITLYDYKNDGSTIIEFSYEDLLQLNELEKIESYKIAPKIKF